MPLNDMENVGVIAGGGSIGLGFVAWMLRRAWRQFSAEMPETRKDQAEAQLFQNLRDEITRMGNDIKQIKADHKAEKQELESRIAELEAKVAKLTDRLGSVRRRALDAYAIVLQCTCPEQEALLAHLRAIIEEE